VVPELVRIQREDAQLQLRGMWPDGQGDDQDRFLADLRALRDKAALGYEELAARAHYPSDILKEAENGPFLPGLPIVSAYVRACDGDVPGWEERWRRLAHGADSESCLPVRPPGASPAAVAGARAGIGVAPPDVYDPERIRAALRGGHGLADHVGQGYAKANGSARGGPAVDAEVAFDPVGGDVAAWSAAAAGTAESSDRAIPAQSQAPGQPVTPTASPGESNGDRLYWVMLLAVIVAAAVIGSVLVMLFR
jgi:hypothetical protein